MSSKTTPLLLIFIGVLRIFRRILDIFLHFIFSVMNFGRKEELPPISNLILLEPATSLAAKIRKKQLRSIDLVQAFISRIREVQPYINAVVEQRIQLALKEAMEADKLIISGEKSDEEIAKDTPFLGVPFTNKEAISVKGLLFTTGLVSRKSMRADNDANVVQLMKYAGGIPLAVTNVSELCMWWESYNNLHGRTNNPYDTSRTSGGSSGGEAALIAAAGSVIGIGSDIGGSIRIPACFNGIFGHKPTTGIVSNEGEFPIAEGDLDSFLSTGPLCRYATDLLPMMKILVENNSSKLRLDSPVRMNTLKIYYMEDDGGNPILSQVHPDMKKTMRKVLNHFEDAYKIKPQKLKLKAFRYAWQIWSSRMANSGAPTFSQEMAERKGEVNCPVELLEWIFGRSKFTLPAILLGISEKFVSPTDSEENRKYYSMCKDLRQELQDLLGDDGIFLYPPHPEPAPHHNEAVLKAFNFVYTAIFNVLGFPVTQCPLGLGSEGLPVGIQVVANFNNDHLTMAVAVELEKTFGGWVCPCPIAI